MTLQEIDPAVASFFQRCAEAQCVVVAVPMYAAYNADGNTDPTHCLGLRYRAWPFEEQAVGPDYWFMLDQISSGLDDLHDTPEAALEAYISAAGARARR